MPSSPVTFGLGKVGGRRGRGFVPVNRSPAFLSLRGALAVLGVGPRPCASQPPPSGPSGQAVRAALAANAHVTVDLLVQFLGSTCHLCLPSALCFELRPLSRCLCPPGSFMSGCAVGRLRGCAVVLVSGCAVVRKCSGALVQ